MSKRTPKASARLTALLRMGYARAGDSLTPREQSAVIVVSALFLLGLLVRFCRAL